MEQGNPDSPLFSLVWIDPERLGGEPCFRGTRVPVRALFDYISEGQPLAAFLDDFPPVTREQVEGVIRLAEAGLFRAEAA